MNHIATLQQVRALAKSFGAEVEYYSSGDHTTLAVTAPGGFHWEGGVHTLVDSPFKPFKPDYADMLERMSFGLDKCDDTCE